MRYIKTLLLIMGLSWTLANAEEMPELQPVPEPPPIPEKVKSGETLEPEVTIIKRKDTTVHEYRANGRLYMVKITPSSGSPYYMVDSDGDGNLETRQDDLASDIAVPGWVILKW
jgi:hypothetical protein